MTASGAKNARNAKSETQAEHASEPMGPRWKAGPAEPWVDVIDSPLKVSATDLRRFVQCPLSVWYSQHEPFETAAPTLGLAVGQIVHACRSALSQAAWKRYVAARKPEDLWSASIEAEERNRIDLEFDRHSFLQAFGDDGRSARSNYSALLLGLERQRAVRGANLLGRGLKGAELAEALLPVEVEVPLFDSENNLVGICDEIWWDGKGFYPVELKTSPPTRSHLEANRTQVAAYATMMNRAVGSNVSTCRIHYLTNNLIDSFRFDRKWSRHVDRLVRQVREVRSRTNPPKGHPSRDICGYCPFQAICPQSAAPGLLATLDAFLERRCAA
jgi:CRISPR-associated protein Cas4